MRNSRSSEFRGKLSGVSLILIYNVAHTLLLADDSVTIQRVIELTFADEDVRVVSVSDGDQAIAALNQSPPDIVLADVEMPGRNGYEVAEHIKSNPRLAHIPIVLLTGALEPIDQARATAVGCEGVLSKPFEPQLVVGCVRGLLDREPQAPPSPEPPRQPSAFAPLPSWPPRFADGRSGVAPARAANPDVDSYFDRLDAAFASMAAATELEAPQPSPGRARVQDVRPGPHERPKDSAPRTVSTAVETPKTAAPLADAFNAFLAAEQRQPASNGAAVWLASRPSAKVTDELVDEVTRRVIDHLSKGDLRTTVDAIVTRVAERLVRDEIDRIKSSIK